MDELESLSRKGVKTLWLSPVQKNVDGGYHGYWIDDFYAIDPHLGTMEELRQLCDKAHALDMKVMIDFVLNHSGVGASVYLRHCDEAWFHPKRAIISEKKRRDREEGWLAGLPDFDQNHPDVADYLIGSALWLIEESGCDAFRLDTVMHVPLDFWRLFCDRIREHNPDFYFLAEVYNYQSATLRYYEEGSGIEGFLNYPLYRSIPSTFRANGKSGALKASIERDLSLPFFSHNGQFFDNHDNPRFMTLQGDMAKEYYLMGLAFILSYPGIPVIYYGTEYAALGGADPDNRKDMDFAAHDGNIERLWSSMLELRADCARRPSSWQLLPSDEESLFYELQTGETRYLFAYNLSDKERRLAWDEQGFIFYFGSNGEAQVEEGFLTLPACSVSVFTKEE